MRTTATLDLAVRLRLAITRTSRRLRQEAGPELSPTLTSALATVDRHGPLTPSELAARERVQRPTATRLVARLEGLGVLQRAADPLDRRSSLLSVTPEGHALMEELRGRKTAYLAHRLEGLDPGERATLDDAAAILERLLEDDRA
ncbi:MAG TPA: MarR family transcriptional regulator [Solirubrobacteraceae bacterium]|nr:MarR family transcriptional regulator [Solirubrobacteraceae bacterium]